MGILFSYDRIKALAEVASKTTWRTGLLINMPGATYIVEDIRPLSEVTQHVIMGDTILYIYPHNIADYSPAPAYEIKLRSIKVGNYDSKKKKDIFKSADGYPPHVPNYIEKTPADDVLYNYNN